MEQKRIKINHNISYLSRNNQNCMRILLLPFSVLLLLFSCKERPKEDAAVVKGKTLAVLPVNPEKVKGVYTGDFKGSPISIVLNYVSNLHASGYDVHKGVNRNLSGIVEFTDGKLHLYLVEPGNSRFDGEFHLELDTAKWKGVGSWKPFVSGKEVSFKLKKQVTKDGDYGQTFIDSLSNYITLKPDGSCTYNYLTDTTNTGQQLTIRGNYKKEKNTVTIYWQKNTVYPLGKSVFKLVTEKPVPGEDYTQQSLKGEGRVFSEILF